MTPASPSLIKRGDDIRLAELESPCVAPGTQVARLNGAPLYTFEANTLATATVTHASCIVGTEPLVCDGNGSNTLDAPEWPLQDVWAIYEVDYAGNRTALDTSQMRIHKRTGTIELGASVFPDGERNIEIECRAGYEQPTTTVTGDWTDWTALEALALRVAEVFYADGLTLRGRQTDLSMGSLNSRVPDFAMPADIEAAVWPFVRTR